MQTSDCYLGIGANLGDRVETIICSRQLLRDKHWCQSLRSSSLYWSSPVSDHLADLDQPAFVNCVFELTVSCSAIDLFSEIQTLELQLGRERQLNNQNAPRLIDIDLLLFDEQIIDLPNLQVPHPRLLQRRFVIEPLLELNNDIKIAGELLSERYSLDQQDNCFKGQELYRLG